MANEFTASCFANFVKGVKNQKRANGTFQDDVTGTKYVSGVQVLSTSQEALDLDEIADPGWCWLRNNSSTPAEIIYVRQASGAANMIEVFPGCEVLFKFAAATTAPYVIAASGTPELEKLIIQR